ncbi:DUF535 family protein [Rosenbergiella collisarenosi]|uniref:DUF535 family protein n=1 Tax=Rosenbergiella collisarenosi TaxID=1544695 RepID=UPI001F500AFA|nr:DUF535 family protein [Rosenbergiella collisarenosi]
MGRLREWRKNNETCNEVLRKFNFSKRLCRTVATHPILYWHYFQQCRHSSIAQQIRQRDDVVSLVSRPFNKYLNKYWTIKQKLEAASVTLQRLEQSIDPNFVSTLFGPQATGITLATLQLKTEEQATLKLMHSRFVREGEMGIYLFTPQSDSPLYSLTFSFDTTGKILCLCGLQGPKPGEGQDQVRAITKAMYGLRPKNLLLSAAYALADGYGVEKVRGIADSHHIKSHHLKSSYNTFWEEVSPTIDSQGWYELPRYEAPRDVELVESKHRSAFRKREALRQQMKADIEHQLQKIADYSQPREVARELQVSNA